MSPTLEGGEIVLVDPRCYRRRVPRPGEIVVFLHPFRSGVRLVKRVAAVRGDRLHLLGDNPRESTDSRSFGSIPLSRLLGRVTAKIPRHRSLDTWRSPR
ncbi:MAG: nickel-type superoxide dismutase maturation protease [Deltaproteobacteria bacterium]|nr:MAG: nickel-type superoxide dismutase maturation protease [Deltaproteobacteria bacterium]